MRVRPKHTGCALPGLAECRQLPAMASLINPSRPVTHLGPMTAETVPAGTQPQQSLRMRVSPAEKHIPFHTSDERCSDERAYGEEARQLGALRLA